MGMVTLCPGHCRSGTRMTPSTKFKPRRGLSSDIPGGPSGPVAIAGHPFDVPAGLFLGGVVTLDDNGGLEQEPAARRDE